MTMYPPFMLRVHILGNPELQFSDPSIVDGVNNKGRYGMDVNS